MRRIAIAVLLAVCAGCGSSHAAPRHLHVADSYLGLDCGDAFPCAHLGIAIWLAAPVRQVTVTLHGRRVALATHRRHADGRFWWGFVRDAVAERVAGDMSHTVRLTVEAVGRDGTLRRTTLTSPVSPGWG